MKKLELLAPVGDKERLEAAVYFGADAVYFAGKKFGLRALASNFDENEIKDFAMNIMLKFILLLIF